MLNLTMIFHEFQMLVIEKLFNKLHGVTMFFKFDLRPSYHQILLRIIFIN